MTSPLKHPALTQLKTERDDVYAFEIDGHLTKEEIERVYQTLEEAYEKHDKISLLMRIGRYDGFDWDTLLSDTAYVGKLHAFRHIRRYALVGGPSWAAGATRFLSPLFRMEVRHFELADETEAWQWIYGNPETEPAKD
ncbi:STAS/SEC14 domain-containing protein [Nitratireductor sp. XY-223]|uniref:STAS/SEC14 domain-containing protein n=1 Tax=Nitratireductor sp. XY-223 TaxID=2561926 RepID=UPI00145B56B0|nr:STAS/SEC14 domain-containing protein [Nitratireductor sp. XY-223]